VHLIRSLDPLFLAGVTPVNEPSGFRAAGPTAPDALSKALRNAKNAVERAIHALKASHHDAAERALDELRRLSGQLGHAQATARQIEKHLMSSSPDIARRFSHDMRAPITAILGWVSLLRAKPGDPMTISRALDTVERNAKSLDALLTEMTKARGRTPPVPVDFSH
jgi:signal transduction histidine kinase